MKRKGFTLLEIIIVLFLITLILGLSTVFFAGYLPSVKLNSTGREIAGMIRQARSFARMNMETRTVTIDLDSRTYGIEGLAPKSFPPDTGIRVIDPFSSEIVQGKYFIVFNPTGGMTGGAILLSSGKRTVRVETDPVTGAVLLK